MPLTPDDLNAIRDLFGLVLDQQLEEKLAERLKAFPTRDDFFASMDRILGELKAIRDEQTSLSHLVVRHEDRLAVLEALHPDGQHV